MRETGFVTHTEYQKHIRGEWRTIHNLWPHIRKYVPAHGYSRAEIDALFAGTQGSIAFADASGFIAEDNANLFWNDILKVLEVLAPTKNTYIGKGVIGAGNATGVGCNVYVGYEVGHDATEATQNTIMGYQAGYKHTSGLQNTLVGHRAGYKITTSQLNTCIGALAGEELTTGYGQNTLLGVNAGGTMTTGYHNISIGKDSGTTITTGMGNICIGHNAEGHETDANYRIAIGYEALSKENNLCVIGGGNVSYHLAIFHKREFRFYDEGADSNYVGFEARDLEASQIWVLPVADGNINDFLQTDGSGNLSWAAGAEVDEKVKVDAEATTGYLGATFNDGVLRTGAPLTYADGGNFITLGVDQTAIDHDVLTNTHDNPYKLDDLAAPDDNTDLDFSTAKHGLVPKGTDIGHFLKDDGTWAAGGGGGAVVFTDLTDTPANYVDAANKIVKVNATPNALVFGADIEELEDVDTITGQAGKYAKVKAGDAGIEWATVDGDGVGGPVLIFDSGFDDLALGDIDGKGDYSLWGTWVNDSGADCTAEIVADAGNGRMLRLDDQSAANACFASLTMTPNISAEVLMGIVEWKVRVSALAANSRGYLNIQDKDIAGTEQGGYFKGDTSDLNYRSSGNQVGKLTDAVVDTWYIVRTFFDRLGNYCVWWLDGAFEQNRIVMNAGDKFDKLVLSTRDIYSGNVFDIKYVKVWSLHYVA